MLSGDHSQGAPMTTSNSLHAPGALRSHRSIVAPAPPLTEEEQEQQQQQQQQLLSQPHRQSGSSGSASSLLQAKQQQRSNEGASVDELSSLSGLQLNSAGDNTTGSGGDGNNVASICAASAKRLVNLEMQMQELFRQQKLVLENQAQMTQQMTLMQQQSQQGGFPYFGGGTSDGGRQSIFCGGGGGAGRASVFSTVSSNGGGGSAHSHGRQSVFCGSQTNSIGRHKSLVARVGQTRQRVRVGNSSGKNSVATAASEAARHGVLGSIFGNAAFQSTSSLQSVLSQQHNSAGRNVSLSYTPASPQNGVATGLATFGDGAGGVPTKSSVASSSGSAAKKAKKARMSVAFALGTDQEGQSDDSDTSRKESVFAGSGGATTTQTSQDRTSPAPLRPLQKPDGDLINKSGAPDSPFKLANTLEPNHGLMPADKSTTSSGANAPGGGAAHSSSTNTYGSSINSNSNPHSGRGPGSREVSQSMEGSDNSQMSAIIKKRGGKGGKQRKSLKSITKKLEHTRKLARMSVVSRADAGGVFSSDTLNGSLLSILPHDLHAQTRLACPDLADSFVSGDEQQPVSAFSLINEEGNPYAASTTKSGGSAAATRPLAASQSANSNSPSSSGIFNPLQKSSNWSSNPMGLSTKPRNHPNLAASGSTRSGPGFEEANSNDASAIARRRQTQKKSVMMGQLISASQQADNIVASFGAEHWLATFVDILYIALSTVVMFVALTRFAWMDDPVSTLTMSLNVIISALTIIFVVVKSRTRNRVNQWEVVDDIAALRKMYFKSVWFGVDLLTIVPIEFIFIGWAHLGYILCMLRHLLRVPRMLTLYRSTHPLTSARQWFVIGFIFSMSALLIETAALIFFAVEPTSPDPYDAFYWTVTTLTSVGYGDIVPTSRDSKYLSMAVQVCGIMIISAITSVATQFLTATDPIDEDIQRRKKMMYSMLRFYDIPWEVQKEVIALFPSILADHNEDQFNELAQDLPKAVGQKIEVFLRRKLISQVPLLRDLGDKTLLLEIASVLTSVMYQPGDYIMQAGDEGKEMYFIASGGVDVLVPLDEELEAVVAVLRTGQWFGEIALLEHTVRTASVQATEECELLVLGQEAFHNVAARYQKLLSVLQEEASIRKHQDEHLCDEDDEDGDDEEDQEGDDSDMVGPQQQRPHFGQQLDDEDEVRRSTEKSASNLNNTSTSLGSDHAPPLSGGGGGALNNEKLTDLFGEGDSRHGSHVLSVASMSTADENNNMPGGLLSGNSRYTPPVGFGGAYSAGSSPRHVPPATGGGGSANSSHNNGETTVTTNTNRSGDEGFFSLVDK